VYVELFHLHVNLLLKSDQVVADDGNQLETQKYSYLEQAPVQIIDSFVVVHLVGDVIQVAKSRSCLVYFVNRFESMLQGMPKRWCTNTGDGSKRRNNLEIGPKRCWLYHTAFRDFKTSYGTTDNVLAAIGRVLGNIKTK